MDDIYRLRFFFVFMVGFLIFALYLRILLSRKRGTNAAANQPLFHLPGFPRRAPNANVPARPFDVFWSQYIRSGQQFEAMRSGLDTRIFDQMTPFERTRAEAAMLFTIYDTRSIYGLGHLRSRAALLPLKLMQKLFGGLKVVYIEQALMRIGSQTGDMPSGAKTRTVLSQLPTSSNVFAVGRAKMNRIEAARALQDFASPETASVLQQTIRQDPEYNVRYWAASSLLHIYGYTYPEVNQFVKEIAPSLSLKSAQPTPEALTRIDALIAGHAIGIVPEQPG